MLSAYSNTWIWISVCRRLPKGNRSDESVLVGPETAAKMALFISEVELRGCTKAHCKTRIILNCVSYKARLGLD